MPGIVDRAKTKAQKEQIIRRLFRLWLKHPELRLTQLMENVFHHTAPDHCFYAIEDFPFLEALEKFYKVEEKKLVN